MMAGGEERGGRERGEEVKYMVSSATGFSKVSICLQIFCNTAKCLTFPSPENAYD